jgi:hypothetical protein
MLQRLFQSWQLGLLSPIPIWRHQRQHRWKGRSRLRMLLLQSQVNCDVLVAVAYFSTLLLHQWEQPVVCSNAVV